MKDSISSGTLSSFALALALGFAFRFADLPMLRFAVFGRLIRFKRALAGG